MTHPLDGAYLKLGRAWHHAKEAKPYFDAFRQTNAYPIRTELDADAGKKLWILDEGHDIPPSLLPIICGEAFYQFRSALAHLAWELVKVNGNRPTRRTAFPICVTPEEWEWNRTKEKIKGMHPDAVAIIKREQPCFGTHSHLMEAYTWLDDLWNVDKHRHLYAPQAGTGGGFFYPGLPMNADWFVHNGSVNAGTVLASVSIEHQDVDFAPMKEIVLGDGVLAVGESAYQLMFSMDSLVNGTLAMFGHLFPDRDASRDAPRPSSSNTGW